MVSEFAMPGPRTIVIEEDRKNSTYGVESDARGILPTALMHTCRASRQIALQRYELVFGKFLLNHPIYFNWGRDCLYFDEAISFQYFCGSMSMKPNGPRPEDVVSWQKKLRHLAIREVDFTVLAVEKMALLGTLKTLTIEDQDHEEKHKEIVDGLRRSGNTIRQACRYSQKSRSSTSHSLFAQQRLRVSKLSKLTNTLGRGVYGSR
jgi:2EXR family